MESGSIHCHVSNLSRRKPGGGERSAVANAAYISGSGLWNEREQRLSDFGNRGDVVFSTLIKPDNAPDWVLDRERLWNTVEHSLKRRDARLAKAITAAITRGIPRREWPELARAYAARFVAQGMIADVAVHDDGSGRNPHVHLLLTVNHVASVPGKPEGFGVKLAHVDSKAFVVQARSDWAELTNTWLAKAGTSLRVDARSFKARGIAATPTRHQGPRRPEPGRPAPHQNPTRTEEPVMSIGDEEDRRAAEAAAREQMRAHRVDDWFNDKVARAETAESVPWYEQARQRAHQEADGPVARATDHLAIERDLIDHAMHQPDTAHEARLRAAVADQPPMLRAEVEAAIIDARLERLRAEGRQQRLDRLADQLSPEARAELEALARDSERGWPRPEPGPYHAPQDPAELAQARERMRQEYEREDERDR